MFEAITNRTTFVAAAITATTVAMAAGTAAARAGAQTIAFDGLQHGQIINNDTFADQGLTIEAVNFRLPGASPIIFDTQFINTADPDLEGPPWAGGNLPIDTVLGNVVIVPENLVDENNDGIVDDPDDEGARPAGQLVLSFDQPITAFSFDLVDIEGVVTETSTIDFISDEDVIGTVALTELVDPESQFFDPLLSFGNNTLNRVGTFNPEDFFNGPAGEQSPPVGFDQVVLNLGGSGAIDNLSFGVIPAPGSAAVLGLAGLAAARRRR